MKDAISVFYPLLLFGLNDEAEEISKHCFKYIERISECGTHEIQDEFKGSMKFCHFKFKV